MLQQLENPQHGRQARLSPPEQRRSSAVWPQHNVLMLAASFPAWLICVQRVKLQLGLL